MKITNNLRSRFIPVLLMDDQRLTKTIKFSGDKYLGDPVNTILTFNEKKVDELFLIDISATEKKTSLDFEFLEKCARSARMPLGYAGGVHSLEDAKRLISIGFEKVTLCSAYHNNHNLVGELASVLGAQSVVICLDVKETEPGAYDVYSNRGKLHCGRLEKILEKLQKLDFGELLISNMSRDGMKTGIDINLLNTVLAKVKVPVTYVGGAASKSELISISRSYQGLGLGAGSAFIFSGKRSAVLPTYISHYMKRESVIS